MTQHPHRHQRRPFPYGTAVAVVAIGAAYLFLRPSQTKAPTTPAPAAPQEAATPEFAAYPAAAPYEGKPAAVVFVAGDPALTFRTVLRQGAAKGPNFAGSYTVVSWGCGTMCQQSAVIDAATGKIVAYNLPSSGELDYRLDSRLLIAYQPRSDLPPSPEDRGVPSYYVMEDGNLKLVGREVDGRYEPFSP